jgi:sugar O-acyltransferase (sialic acid O-acetyltransferase NeuD family)
MHAETKPLIIVGDGEFAEIVERPYMGKDALYDLPIIPFEELEQHYSPDTHAAFVAITSTKLNRVRTRLYNATKAKGFALASYISSKAFFWHNATIGENSFIFEQNVVQHHVAIGNNVVLWSGNHIGHRTVIHDHCFLASHVVISGYCEIGASCFLGVNSCLGNNLTVGHDSVIGAGAVIVRDVPPEGVYVGNPAKPLAKSSYETFNVQEHER